MEKKFYKIQSYLVKFDLGSPVDVHINVYENNQNELTRDEIIKEALAYGKDAGIQLNESELFDIITLELE